MGKQLISIIICTFNRCENLKDSLNSILKQEFDDSFDYEIIVVDNNSNDQTKEVVSSYITKFNERLRYVFEAQQGLAYARNRGIRESGGEIVAFIDDDCIAEQKWLLLLYQVFKKYNADMVGGKSLPVWSEIPPMWLFYNFIQGKLSLLDYGDEEFKILSKNYELYGCNIAFKKNTMLEFGKYNEDLGRKGASLFAGEDTEMFLNFLTHAKSIYYQPKAIVYHKMLPERMRKDFFRRRCFYGGRSIVRMGKDKCYNKANFNLPKYLFKDLLINIYRWFCSALFFHKERKLYFELEISFITGKIYEYCVELKKFLKPSSKKT